MLLLTPKSFLVDPVLRMKSNARMVFKGFLRCNQALIESPGLASYLSRSDALCCLLSAEHSLIHPLGVQFEGHLLRETLPECPSPAG